MLKKLRYLIMLIPLLLCYSNHVNAKSIDMIVGLSKPPYVIEETQMGFEIELITKVFKNMALEPVFIYVPLGRNKSLLDKGMGQGILTINEHVIPNAKLRTDPYVTYQNVAISLSKNNISVNQITDLKNYKVAAFHSAHLYLGPDYKEAVANNKNYIEVPNQFRQVKMLLQEKVELLIIDKNIFKYYLDKIIEPDNSFEVAIDLHYIFPENHYSLAFKDSQYVTLFNRELKRFQTSRDYVKLLSKYKLNNKNSPSL